MKIITTAAIVALCGLLQIAFSNGSLADLQTGITLKQQDVLNITHPLLLIKDEIVASTSFNKEKDRFYLNVSSTIATAMQDLENKVSVEIAAGNRQPETGSCGEEATACFNAVNRTAFAEFDICAKNITTFRLNFLNYLDSVLMEGHKVELYLASIIPTCSNTDLNVFETCVADLAQNTTAQVESYRRAAETALEIPNAYVDLTTVLLLFWGWGVCMENVTIQSIATSAACKAATFECVNALPANN